jgi:Reverse transcriptase (RNA-dependent DNA polymerase)
LFNRVLETGVSLVKWTKANMVFIPKGDTPYRGTLNTLRPITILETIQKTFLKVLYSRITNVITQNKILKGANTSVLPSTSTHYSLLPLNVFLTEIRRTGKPGHFFLEDKSAAFDSITFEHIYIALKRIGIPKKIPQVYHNILTNRECRVFTAYSLSDSFKPTKDVPQGGVESPLVWILCYDICLTRIKNEGKCFTSSVFPMQASPTINEPRKGNQLNKHPTIEFYG